MDDSTLKTLLSRLSRQAFEAFIVEFYNSKGDQYDLNLLREVGDGVYYRGLLDSYGQSLHSVFILQYLPLELLRNPEAHLLDEDILVPILKRLFKFYKGQKGAWGMVSESLRYDYKLKGVNLITNLHDIEIDTYLGKLVPQFSSLIKRVSRRKTIGAAIGSFDSYIELANKDVKQAFSTFLENHSEGLRISLLTEKIMVEQFATERNLTGGVLPKTAFPYETLFVNNKIQKEEVLREFESIINKDTSEATLERFLVAHYRDIFGAKYDRIETQLWLRFPELGMAGNKRLDIFLRNSVINDWELFEIKRIIKLSGTYRDIPVLAREVSYTIQQTKNYARILSQHKVKKYFAEQGIEYFEPSLNIVVGNKPQISQEDWRWLVSSNKDVNILTFDNLLNEMRLRLYDRDKIFED